MRNFIFISLFFVFCFKINCAEDQEFVDLIKAEGLLLTDVENIQDGTVDEDKFIELFPRTKHKPLDHGMYVGQIRLFNDVGCGTGTLIDIEKKGDGVFEATGISSLHLFVKEYSKGSNIPFAPKDKIFFQESIYDDEDEEDENGDSIIHRAEFEIQEVLVQDKLSKDICLFKGIYKLNAEDGQLTKEQVSKIIEKYIGSLPHIQEKEDFVQYKKCYMHHHPLLKKDQRVNEGMVDFSSRKHQISTLFGSSGASIVPLDGDQKGIVGIHTGYHSSSKISKSKELEYVFKEVKIKIFAVENNGFDIVYLDDILNIKKNGLSLYGMGKKELADYLGEFPKNNGWW